MIIRSIASRQGRQALTGPAARTCLRALTTGTAASSSSSAAIANDTPPLDIYTHTTSRFHVPLFQSSTVTPQITLPDPSVPQPYVDPNAPKPLTKDIANIHVIKRRIKRSNDQLGSTLQHRYIPQLLLERPRPASELTVELLMANQTHMGHNKGVWNPHNSRYIIGVREGIHIISLEETMAHLRRAAKVVEEVAYAGGLILFVGNRKGQMEIVVRAAELAGACHLHTKWKPGLITNRDVILESGEMRMVDENDEELEGFDSHLNDARPVMPDLVVVLNPVENYTALHECALANIPTIGVIDTDANPTLVTYPIPANDDSLRSIAVIAGALGLAGGRGQKRRHEAAANGISTWENPPEVDEWMVAEKSRRQAAAEKAREEETARLKLAAEEAQEQLPGSDEMTLFGWGNMAGQSGKKGGRRRR